MVSAGVSWWKTTMSSTRFRNSGRKCRLSSSWILDFIRSSSESVSLDLANPTPIPLRGSLGVGKTELSKALAEGLSRSIRRTRAGLKDPRRPGGSDAPDMAALTLAAGTGGVRPADIFQRDVPNGGPAWPRRLGLLGERGWPRHRSRPPAALRGLARAAT